MAALPLALSRIPPATQATFRSAIFFNFDFVVMISPNEISYVKKKSLKKKDIGREMAVLRFCRKSKLSV